MNDACYLNDLRIFLGLLNNIANIHNLATIDRIDKISEPAVVG